MLDQLLNYFPPILVNHTDGQKAYLTIGAADGHWQSGYMNDEGDIINGLFGKGITVSDALTDLRQTIEVMDMLARPSIPVDELTGRMKTSTDNSACDQGHND
jgi:hypothetical protein